MKNSLFVFFVLILPVAGASAEESWKREADARIEQHRKSDVEIVVTRNGKPVPDATVSIKMKRHEFLFGCNILKWGICATQEQNLDYYRRFEGLFNSATMPFFWWSYEQEPGGKYMYSYSDDVSSWCFDRGIRTIGHPLLWNWEDQSWAKDVDEKELCRRLVDRMSDCTSRFKGSPDSKNRIGHWVVCNELVAPLRDVCRNNAPKLTSLIEKEGPVELARKCFRAARKGNPEAKLLINDYETGENYVELIEKLVDENGKPLYDMIGIQSHMHAGAWSNEYLWEVCERFSKFDKPLYFTELTLLSSEKPFDWNKQEVFPGTPEGERRQKDEAVRVYTMLFSHPKVEMITWWDLSDQGAWMDSPAGVLHADMSPKPIYEALKTLIQETWATNETLKTDKQGKVNLRAFRGTYDIEIVVPNEKECRKGLAMEVEKGKNVFLFDH